MSERTHYYKFTIRRANIDIRGKDNGCGYDTTKAAKADALDAIFEALHKDPLHPVVVVISRHTRVRHSENWEVRYCDTLYYMCAESKNGDIWLLRSNVYASGDPDHRPWQEIRKWLHEHDQLNGGRRLDYEWRGDPNAPTTV